MADAIAVLNAGSSSIKFSVFIVGRDGLEQDVHGQIEGIHSSPHFVARDAAGRRTAEHSWDKGFGLGHAGALAHLVQFLQSHRSGSRLVGFGHRVVHGGLVYQQPVRVDKGVLAILEKLIPLAPLHQPHNLHPIRVLMDSVPAIPQVACFDTAFHGGSPEIAQMFALPPELHAEGVRRFGFHGLSYEYIASVLPDFDSRAARGRCVVMHLGNGASLCALLAGRSVASTMGFTAVEGLMMGTRSGSLDPGVMLYLMNHKGMDARAIERLIYEESGLLGVSGVSSDMRTLLASTEPRARLAIELYVYRIRRELGSLAAALGGLDAIVFTAGIGENAASIRERVCRDAEWLGVELDPAANHAGGPRISTPQSRIQAWVIPTSEELMIARHTHRLLGSRARTSTS